jgi:hypothetical protein
MRCVVVEHQARTHGVFEVEDIQARRGLIEPVAVTARVDAEQTAEEEAESGLVRDDRDRLPGMLQDERSKDRQRARHDREPRLPALGRERERIFLPRGVLLGELRLDFAPGETLPAAMISRRPGNVSGTRPAGVPRSVAVSTARLIGLA